MEIDLNTIGSEYIALIQAMRNNITFMALMGEVSFIFDINLPRAEAFCEVYEDNQSCISVAESNKFSRRTKKRS